MKRIHTCIIRLTVLAVSLLLQACSDDGRSRSALPINTAAPGIGEIVSLDAIETGMCATTPTETLYLSDVEIQPCGDAHAFEIAGILTLEADAMSDYPGGFVVESEAYEQCQTVFEDYSGVPFWDSGYDLKTVTPSASTWLQGDREVICLVVNIDGTPLLRKVGQ